MAGRGDAFLASVTRLVPKPDVDGADGPAPGEVIVLLDRLTGEVRSEGRVIGTLPRMVPTEQVNG